MAVVSETEERAVGYYPTVVDSVTCLFAGDLTTSICRASSSISWTVVVRVNSGLFLEGFGEIFSAATILHTRTARVVGAAGSMYHILDHNIL